MNLIQSLSLRQGIILVMAPLISVTKEHVENRKYARHCCTVKSSRYVGNDWSRILIPVIALCRVVGNALASPSEGPCIIALHRAR